MRKVFKSTTINNQLLLYPVPVIKEEKYLIFTTSKFEKFYLFSFEAELINSPDSDKTFLDKLRLHTDSKTWIYSINVDKLKFNILPNKHLDPDKASKVEAVISDKIKAFLRDEIDSEKKLLKVMTAQLKCSTCQKLGIDNSPLKEVLQRIDLLSSDFKDK